MNIYKLILNTCSKSISLALSKLINANSTAIFNKGSINNNLNLMMFTLETFDLNDFKTLLLNYNKPNIVSVSNFLATPPCYIFLFDADGKLFRNYKFHIHKPENKEAELVFEDFLISLKNHIFESCVDETTKKNVSAENYKFYMHISS